MKTDIRGMSDMLETVSVLRSAKNLFFAASFLALLVLGAIFALSRLGTVNYPWDATGDKPSCTAEEFSAPNGCALPYLAAVAETNQAQNDTPNADNEGEAITTAEKLAQDAQTEPDVIREQAAQAVAASIDAFEQPKVDEEKIASEQSNAIADMPHTELPSAKKWLLSWLSAATIITLCNTVLALSLTLYCLTLLICLKITLVGRLGAAYYITSAFFFSLFAAVVFMPWQAAFPNVGLTGAMFTPYELACAEIGYQHLSRFCKLVFYVRYAGLWGLVVFALIMAQTRSICWAARAAADKPVQ